MVKRVSILFLLLLLLLSSSCLYDDEEENHPPIAAITATPQTGNAPLTVRFDASGSSDPDGDTLLFSWSFGDETSASGVTVDHTYIATGTFTAILTVKDGKGGSDEDSLVITVNSPNDNENIYYVSTNGSDSDPGSFQKPWKTLQYAANRIIVGDTVIIKNGLYSAGFTIATSGTSEKLITFKGESRGGVIIEDSSSATDCIFLDHSNYIFIENIKVINAKRAGIRLSYSDHVTIKDSIFSDNGKWGIFTDFSDNTTIEKCETSGSKEEHGIYISNSSDYAVIRQCISHNNAACGIQINADPGMGGDGISSNCTVNSNICYENGRSGGAAINLASVRSSTISNNVIYNNYAGGIAAWDDGQGIQWGCKNLNILNNTIYFQSGEGRWAVSLKNGSSNAVILNNILLGGSKGGFEFTDDSQFGLNINYNIYFSYGSNHVAMNDSQGKSWNLNEWKALGYDLSSIWAEHSSIMINIITGDPHLKPGSSAIDRGTIVQLFTDYEGDKRPQGAGFDIGADEKK